MRIYMQQAAFEGRPPKFIHLHLLEDLLEGWSLIKESGQQGSAGRVVKKHFVNRDNAIAAMVQMRDDQLNRGFRVVFMQGDSQN